MPKTPLMLELQITKEYLGQQTSMTYLGPLYEEALRADTYAHGPGSTVANVIDGSLDHHALSGMAGVANIGNDRNWCGSIFNQANWYVFGRMAWNPDISARAVAEEWTRQTFNAKPAFVAAVVGMMMQSRETTVDYMTPLGLNMIMGPGFHYGPAPWDVSAHRVDWTAPYYHHAAADGLGYDRTKTGSDQIAQYNEPLRDEFANVKTTPEKYLLWFHHVPWDYKLKSGRTLWNGLIYHYRLGVARVKAAQKTWAGLRGDVDPARFNQITAFLKIEAHEAGWWRDACLAYFQTFSHLPFPPGYAPKHSLEYYKNLPNDVSPPQ
jgi:alpha-glucuronidase